MELPETIRKIIHIDMDAFYASVEQLDDPDLKGKPVAVGGSEIRGVVAAASYEARKFGVKSAMPGITAKRLCPELIFVKPRFERYKEVSNQIREIFYRATDLVEPLALDEAFLDVTQNKYELDSATLIASKIRQQIFETTGLTASAGISINKFTAKIASDVNKPNGQKTIPPEEVLDFLEKLPIEKFFGVGKVTADKMKQHGIFFGGDLKQHSKEYLKQHFGKSGIHFYDIVRGVQNSEVKPNRIRKSLAAERTFNTDYSNTTLLGSKLELICEELYKRLQRSEVTGRTLTLKIKYADFTQQTRSRTSESFFAEKDELLKLAIELLNQDELRNSVRLLGLSMSNLNNEEEDDTQNYHAQLEFEF